jgi:hypothetical protein
MEAMATLMRWALSTAIEYEHRGDDVANLAIKVLLRPNLLKGREIEVPITRLTLIDPTPVKRFPANPGDDCAANSCATTHYCVFLELSA